MTGRSRAAHWAAVVLAAVVLSACIDAGDDPGTSAGQTLRAFLTEPPSLLPGMAGERPSSTVLKSLFSPLIGYDDETGEPYPLVAAELPASADNRTWLIEIAEGWTFHNGEAVTAQSFIDAWDWAAYGPHEAGSSYYFGPGHADIVGYADVQGGVDPDADGPQQAPRPGTDAMSGLRLINDRTFSVTLARPMSQFPLLLGHAPFYPLPSICIENWEVCNEAPIGNGPFQMNGAWEHDRRISVRTYDDYPGPRPSIAGIDFQIYPDVEAGFRAMQEDELDYLSELPADLLPRARAEFGDRVLNQVTAQVFYLAFPLWDARFGFGGPDAAYGGEAGRNLRHALSMAIDRERLADSVSDGAVTPASSLVPPEVYGHRPSACGDWCTYDLEAARELYDASPGLSGPVSLWYFDTGGPMSWVQDVAAFWRTAFGIDVELRLEAWPDQVRARSERTLDGPSTVGWKMDYPSAVNFLAPVYARGAGLGEFGYVNDEVESLLDAGDSARTIEGAFEAYGQAEHLILEDMPTIPLWFGNIRGGYSQRVDDVVVDGFGNLDYVKVTVAR